MWIVCVTQNCVANTCVINTGCHTFLHECVLALIGGSFPVHSAPTGLAFDYGNDGGISFHSKLGFKKAFQKNELGRRDQEAAVDQADLG